MATSNQQTAGSDVALTSKLYKIQAQPVSPYELFKQWRLQAENGGVIMANALNLATSDGQGRVSARSLLLRQLDDDGFVIMTDGRSKKSFDLDRCSRAAMTFLWMYPRSPSGHEARQVRVEGHVTRESFDDYKHLHTKEPFYCKVRSSLCRQGELVHWEKLEQQHASLVTEAIDPSRPGLLDEPPAHYAVFKMHPEMIEFYASNESSIGDRVVYRDLSKPSLIPCEVLESLKVTYTNGTATNGHENKGHSEKNGAHEEGNGEEDLVTTFNNGLHIDTGFSTLTSKKSVVGQGKVEWVNYHVSA